MIIICFSIYTLSVHSLLQKALICESQAKRICTLLIPQTSYLKLIVAGQLHTWSKTAYMIKDYVLWVSVLVIHPIAKMRIGQNILFPRIASESKTYLNKKWEKVLLEQRRWNLFRVPETHHTYVTSSHRHGRWKERVTQCWSVPESVPRYILKMR